ncbi:uncharacterized protein RJT21DRAFT_254 [Scheffersomyces amazonensis]|uniref:uncharacterized protein n=1 Tax=Scheffersomyces amazonensis TaxID=1078765 RepID=UPI00315D50CB
MAPTSWRRGPVCGVDNCRSRLYRYNDGLTICQFGHVMEGGIEINDDQDQAQITTRRLNLLNVDERGSFTSTSMSQSQSSLSRTKDNRLYGHEAKELLYRCFQVLLKKQLENIMRLYFTDSIREDLELIVKTNWIKVISKEIEHEGNSKFKKLYHLDLIAIIYISVLQIRFQPIYTYELLDYIKTNQIPYIRCLHLIPSSLLSKLPNEHLLRLQATSLPLSNEFYYCIQEMMKRLYNDEKVISIPVNYYYPYAFKLLTQELLLPNAIDLFNTFVTLTKKFYNDGQIAIRFNETKSKHLIYFPEVILSSMIIFIIKLSIISKFKLFPYQINFKNWYKHLTKYEANNEFLNYSESSNVNDLIEWSDDKIDKYCDWVYEQLIPKKNKTYTTHQSNTQELEEEKDLPELTTMEKRLFQIFNVEESSGGSGSESEPPSRSSSRSPVPREIQKEETINMNDVLMSAAIVSSNVKGKRKRTSVEEMKDLNKKLVSKISVVLGITQSTLSKSILQAETDIENGLMS